MEHETTTEHESKPLPQLVGELATSTWALAALGCADETGLLGELGEPRSAEALASRTGVPAPLVEAVLGVLLALGLARRDGEAFAAEPALAASLTGPARALLRADLRSHLLQSCHLVEGASQGTLTTGWRHTHPEILQAQGTRSSAIAATWADHVFPCLDGLDLDAPGAVFLDVGTGVAALAIEVCRRFPSLQAVGLDPWKPALAEARSNVEAAQLGHRISLRDSGVEELADDSAFDLVHLPILFLSTEHASRGLRRVRTALKPGGWVVLQLLATSGSGLTPAVLRLCCVLWGGDASMTPTRAERMLTDADYEDVRTFPAQPGLPLRYVVGRRPSRHGVGSTRDA